MAAKYGDLEAYAWAVHGLHLEPYQLAWAEALESEDRVAIVCPPDTYKSTTVRLYVERAIGLNKDIRILWVMNAGEQSEKQVMTIQQTIESNPVYRAAFDVQPDKAKQWTKSVLFVRRNYEGADPTLMAVGWNGPYQGLHFDLIVLDDLTNQEDVRSPTTMEQQRLKLRGVILDRSTDSGRIVSIFTRWGPEDLHDTFAEIGFTVITMPLIGDYPWGPTISPYRFPLEVLEGKRRDKGDYLFTMTYLCDVRAATGAIINREHINYYGPMDLPREGLQVFAGIDPAPSTTMNSDYSAIATVGIHLRTRTMYLLDMWAKRVEVPDLETEIVRRAVRTAGLRQIALETVGFQLGLMQSLRRKYKIPMVEIPYRTKESAKRAILGVDRSKAGRAMYLDSLFTSRRLYIPKDLVTVDGVSLESELCRFGLEGSYHDDRADATSFACIIAESACQFQDMSFDVRVNW